MDVNGTRTPRGGLELRLAVILPVVGAALILAALYVPVLGLAGEADLSALERAGWWAFRAKGCGACHLLTLPAQRRGRVPDLRTTPRRTDDWYRAYLVDPRAVLPNSPMSSYAGLSGGEVAAVTAFLRRVNAGTRAGPLSPPEAIPAAGGDLASYGAGRSLYTTYCAGCHGDLGHGGGRVGHLLSPEPRDFTDAVWMNKQTDAYLYSVIADGKPGTAMPGFRETLTAPARALVLRYLRHFADPVLKERMDFGFVVSARPQ